MGPFLRGDCQDDNPAAPVLVAPAPPPGPPLVPGLRAPSICTIDSWPRSSVRMLEMLPLPTVMAGLLLLVASALPNGKPKVYTGMVSTRRGGWPKSIGRGRSLTPATLR